jgi:hypothetical protein
LQPSRSLPLDKGVEHLAVLIHSTPKIIHLDLDLDEGLVQMPLVTRATPLTVHLAGKAAPNFSHHRRTVSSDTTMPRSDNNSSTPHKLKLKT